MRDRIVGIVPVLEGKRVIGVITDRDLAVRGHAEGILGSAQVRNKSDRARREEGCGYSFKPFSSWVYSRFPCYSPSSGNSGTVFDDDHIKTAEAVFKRLKFRRFFLVICFTTSQSHCRLLVLERETSHLVGILSMDDIALGLGHRRAGAVLEGIVTGSL